MASRPVVGRHERHLVRKLLGRRGQLGLALELRGVDHGVQRGAHPEPLAEHARIEGSHAGRVGRQPPRGEPAGRRLVGPQRDGDADGDPRGRRRGGARLAVVEQRAAVGHARARPQERRPFVGELAREADRLRRERRQHQRHRRLGRRARRAAGGRRRPGWGSRSPASSARIAVSVSRSRSAGRSQAMPCSPSVSGGLPAPTPSEKRPPEQRCRPAAASAMRRRRAAPRGDDPRYRARCATSAARSRPGGRSRHGPLLGDLHALQPARRRRASPAAP